MKKMFSLWAMVLLVLLFGACTADYDTFGSSDYKAFNDITFEEQEGGSSVFADEHLINVTLKAPKKKTWDSVTIEHINISSMATLHLVDGKFKEFPSDSAALDSLANHVSYVEKSLKEGSRIRIPASLRVYLMVVSESGEPSLWQLSFTIPGVEVSSSSVSGDDENSETSSSSVESDDESSSSQEESSSSSQEVLSDDVSFSLKFVGELANDVNGDTIFVTFPQGTDLKKVVVDSASVMIHRKASLDSDPLKVKDWSSAQSFKVTAEDSSAKTWIVIVQSIKNSAAVLNVAFKDQLKVNRSGDTVAIKLVNGMTLEEAVLDSFTVSDGASVKPVPSEVKEWKDVQSFTVTAENGNKKTWVVTLAIAEAGEKASDKKELISISALGEVKDASIDAANKKVVLHLASQESMKAVEINVSVSASASHNLQDGAIDLRAPVEMTITAEDASYETWTISADYPLSSEAKILKFALEGVATTDAPAIDDSRHTITMEVPYEAKLAEVFFVDSISAMATQTPAKGSPLDLSSGSATITVVAEDGTSVEWSVVVTKAAPVQVFAPRILSMKIDGKDAVVDSVSENGKLVYWVHYDNLDFLSDLTALKVSDIKLSEGASVSGVEEGSGYDLGRGIVATVSNSKGEKLSYEIRAGYQYPNSNLEKWTKNKPDSWDNGNQSVVTITSSTSSYGSTSAHMTTKKAAGVLASGNLFIGTFNPKGVPAISLGGDNMLKYDDGNELIDFGKPFAARPRYMEVDLKYTPKGNDSCDAYIILENRTSTVAADNSTCYNMGCNVKRSSSDVNTLVASAWFRSNSDSDDSDPDVVSISSPNEFGLRTVRLKLKYGAPLEKSPIMNVGSEKGKVSVLYEGALLNSKGIDNHVVVGDGSLPVTHIRIVVASSADGNHYEGSEGSVLIADNIRLIY